MILAQYPESAIFLSGSVAFGDECPDSDLDLNIIVPEVHAHRHPNATSRGEPEAFRTFDHVLNGVALDLRFITPTFFEEILQGKPWRGYRFLKQEILHDPHGFLQSWKDRTRPWFEAHPDVVALWEEWNVQYAERRRTKGQKVGDLVRQFPYMTSDLWPYLDERFSKDGMSEQISGGDSSSRADAGLGSPQK